MESSFHSSVDDDDEEGDVEECHAGVGCCDGESFFQVLFRSFAFACVFCWPRGDFKLSMRLLVFLVRAGGKLSESERGSRSVCISAHTHTHSHRGVFFVCARVSSRIVCRFPLVIFSFSRKCVCVRRISPSFSFRNRPAFP